MKQKRILCGILTVPFFLSLAWAGQSWYGPSGYAFVPDGFVNHGSSYGGFISGDFSGLERADLYPQYLGFRWSGFSDRLEITLSNCYGMVGDDGYDPEDRRVKRAPVIPGIKWSIDDQNRQYVRIGLVVGAMFPYGLYCASTVQAKNPILQPELTLGLATVLNTTYGLAGGRLRLADLQGRPLPLSFVADGGWAGYMKRLGEIREAFYSFGGEVEIGRNIVFSATLRKDPRTYKDLDTHEILEHQNKSGRWSLKVDYHFDGVKQMDGEDK
ncbi:MAG TPA: hypothetical protein VLM37_00195 [Fibrobacteraceae bacterium]|nr:hypothetical protein [Fibrobacteraceae bacterium]